MSNQIVWFDLPVLDLDRATRFYSQVLKVEMERVPDADVVVFPHTSEGVSGCLYTHGSIKPSEHGALIYFNAQGRLDDAERAVEPAGGTIVQSKHSIAPWGFRVVALDSEGNRIALHSM